MSGFQICDPGKNFIATNPIISPGSQLRGKPRQSSPPTGHFQDRPVLVIEVHDDPTLRTDLSEKF